MKTHRALFSRWERWIAVPFFCCALVLSFATLAHGELYDDCDGDVDEADRARHGMLDALSLYDDELMEILLEEQEPTAEQLRASVRRATRTAASTRASCASRATTCRACSPVRTA